MSREVVPVIRLTIEVDGDVHPELHAVLASIANAGSRGERLKQWAAAGLIWEQVRIHGAGLLPTAAVIGPAPAAPGPAFPASRFGSIDAPDGHAPDDLTGPFDRPYEVDFTRREASDFVDLALDARPLPAAPGPLTPPAAAPAERVHRNVPVLLDVVETEGHEPVPQRPAPVRRVEPPEPASTVVVAPAAVTPPVVAPVVAAPPVQVAAVEHEAVNAAVADEGPAPAASGTRSRLMRMKERGLFKNG